MAAVLAATLGLGAWWAIALQAAPSPAAVDAQRGQIRALEAELQAIDADASAAASAHATALRRVTGLRVRIADTTASLREAREARGIAQERLSDRLVAIYVDQPSSFVEVLLTSGGLSQAADAQAALQRIGASDAALVRRMDETRARLTRLRADLVASRAEATASLEAASARMDELQGLLGERRAVLDRARGSLERLLAERGAAARRASARAVEAAGEEAEQALLRRASPGVPGPAAAASPPVPSPAPAPEPSVAEALERIAQCESGGDPTARSSNGLYFGKYQFSLGTWASVGGSGNPAEASEQEQDERAAILYARSGPAPWPVCGYQ